MCDDVGYDISRSEAEKLFSRIREATSATITIEDKMYCKEDGGNWQFALAARGSERVGLTLVLGEEESDVGPYDGLCYVGICQRRWWWQKWSPLMSEIVALVSG